MKLITALFVLFGLCTAQASQANLYDSVFLDCIDYGHSKKSEKELKQCHQQAKTEVLTFSAEIQSAYLDCIDYNHSPVSLEKDIACLREASRVVAQ